MSYHAYNVPPPMPVDPTNVAGKRIAAWVIDGIIFVVLILLLGTISGRVLDIHTTQTRMYTNTGQTAQQFCDDWNSSHDVIDDGICAATSTTAATGNDREAVTIVTNWLSVTYLYLVLFGILFVVFCIIQGAAGASAGKAALGLRVIKSDGTQAGIGASFLRSLLWVVDAITCGLPIIGGVLILTTTGHRRVGDMAAGTYVVPQSQIGHPVILPGQPGWGTYQTVGTPPGGYPPSGGYTPLGQPGQPSMGPPSAPPPWAPTVPPSESPTGPPGPLGETPEPSAPTADVDDSATAGDYEADRPTWDDARQAYIQYDSARGAWLEFDDRIQQWKPIST